MVAYKLFKSRKDGSIGPLYINCLQRIDMNVWLEAEDHPTKGFAHRPGWHCCTTPSAPHIKEKEERVWYLVEIEDYTEFIRPKNQGGKWYLANRMKVIERLK